MSRFVATNSARSVGWTKRLALSTLGVVGVLTYGGSELVAQGTDSRLTLTTMSAALSDGGTYEFEMGVLRVPQNRANPDGPVFELVFHRFPALPGADPSTPPVFDLRGGPGWPGFGSELEREGWIEQNVFRRVRVADVVVVGQRGIGTSGPNTTCQGPRNQNPAEAEDVRARLQAAFEAARACRLKWEEAGVDLTGITVIEAAQDVRDVAEALGYDKIQISGGSFGSHWGMTVLRYHPDIVERAVLTGMEGPDHTYDMPGWILAALERVAADAEASGAFEGRVPPDGIIAGFREVIARAEASPIPLGIPRRGGRDTLAIRLTADDLRRLSGGFSRTQGGHRMRAWPADMIRLFEADYEEAANMALRNRAMFGLPTAAFFMFDCGSGISASRLGTLIEDPGAEVVGPLGAFYQALCPAWEADLGDAFRENFYTDVPTVIVHGNWDTSTPLENAQELLPFFRNHHFVLVERGSHGALGEALRESSEWRRSIGSRPPATRAACPISSRSHRWSGCPPRAAEEFAFQTETAMAWLQTHWIALAMLAGYGALLVRHAIEGRRQTEGHTDFYVGGRSMGGVVLGLSFFATYSSTNSFVGFAGQSYTYGAPWLLTAPAVVIFSVAAWIWVAPRLRAFTGAVDSVTLADYIGFRFESRAARSISALIVILASFLYMIAVFKGIGNLLEIFLDIPYVAAIAFVFVVVLAYTAVGGFISVVKTDAVQGVIMVIAGILLFWGTVNSAGGLDAIEGLRHAGSTADLFRWDAAMPFPVLIGIVVAGTLKFIVDPRQLSRFYALADRRAVRRGLIVSTAAFLVVYTLILPIGLYAHAVLGSGLGDSDLVVPTLLGDAEILPAFPAAFILVALLAAAMSSLDSVLLVMASTWQRDVVSMFREVDDGRIVGETRKWVGVFAVITALLAVRPPGSIVTLTAFSGSLYAACFFPAVVYGLSWKRGTGAGAVASLTAGVMVLLAWSFLPFADAVHRVFPAMAVSSLLYVGFALARPPLQSAKRLDTPLQAEV